MGCFSAALDQGRFCPHEGHLAVCGDTDGYHSGGERAGLLGGSGGWRPGMQLYAYRAQGNPTTQNDLVPNVTSAKAEKSPPSPMLLL